MLTEIDNKYSHYFVDDTGRKQGEFKLYFDNGYLRRHCFFVNDLKDGKYKSYRPNGCFYVHTHYYRGKIHGEYKRYLLSGRVAAHRLYINNTQQHKIARLFTAEDKIILALQHEGIGFL